MFYQVIDISQDGVYLQNTKNNKVFHEQNLPEGLYEIIDIDSILSYKNGEYILEQELTEDFWNSMVEIGELKKIQREFEEESCILKLPLWTTFKVLERNEYFSILTYGEKKENTIKTPNALLPYFIYEDTILIYKNGKFEIFKTNLDDEVEI